MIYPIRYYGDPILRQRARAVTRFDDNLAQAAQDMIETMYDANGIGLAAPQVGIPRRFFIALEIIERDEEELSLQGLTIDEKRAALGVIAEHVMINPEILVREGLQHGPDGCLSLPGVYFDKVPRDEYVKVRYQDVQGNPHEMEANGHLAHVIQHEYDHLEGKMFLERIPKNKQRAFLNDKRQEIADSQRQARAQLKRFREEPFNLPKIH